MLQRIRIQLDLIRLGIKNIPAVNIFHLIGMAKFGCMDFDFRKVFCLDITHEKIRIWISSSCSWLTWLKFWKLFPVP